ncbi:MAG: hypothetical protein WDZ35_08835 [Crocinitomicaceae bacterium]
MGLNFEYKSGQTPLDEDEKEGLLVKTISTQEELDQLEQQNIEKGILWTIHQNTKPEKRGGNIFLLCVRQIVETLPHSWNLQDLENES